MAWHVDIRAADVRVPFLLRRHLRRAHWLHETTVIEGDRVLTDKRAYDLRLPFTGVVLWHRAEPKRGDIVVLYSPEDGMRLLKRWWRCRGTWSPCKTRRSI